jgi:hypothetical protein
VTTQEKNINFPFKICGRKALERNTNFINIISVYTVRVVTLVYFKLFEKKLRPLAAIIFLTT